MTTPPRNQWTVHAPESPPRCSVTVAGPQWRPVLVDYADNPVVLTVDVDDDYYSTEVPLTEEQANALLYVLMDALGLDRVE